MIKSQFYNEAYDEFPGGAVINFARGGGGGN